MLSERLLTRQEMLSCHGSTSNRYTDAGLAEFARAAGLKVQEIERPQSDDDCPIGMAKTGEKRDDCS